MMDRPLVTLDQAIDLAREIFSLKVDSSSAKSAKQLDSYDDRNFYLYGMKDGKEGEFLLKVYNSCYDGQDLVDAIHQVMFCLKAGGVVCPVPQKTVTGDYIELRKLPQTPRTDNRAKKTKLDEKEKDHLFPCYVCLFTFVPGKTVKDCKEDGHTFTQQIFYLIGQLVANIVVVLKDLKCPVLEERKFAWDLYYFDTLLQGQRYLTVEDKKLVKAVICSFKTLVKPKLDVLPKQCIHGDLNDANLIMQRKPDIDKFEVIGAIDFGDVNYSCRIFEIAITAAYMMTIDEDDPVTAAACTVAGFHDKSPLMQGESDVIYYCIQARLCQSLCFGTHSSKVYPDNATYLLYNANKVSKILSTLLTVSKERFDEIWRNLCKN